MLTAHRALTLTATEFPLAMAEVHYSDNHGPDTQTPWKSCSEELADTGPSDGTYLPQDGTNLWLPGCF